MGPSRPYVQVRRMLALLLLGGGVGCSTPVSTEPPIPDSTLVDVLVDLHVLEARDETLGDVPPALFDSVLTRHGLDSTRYNASLRYYSRHPEAYRDLYDDVIDRLNELWEGTLPMVDAMEEDGK